MRYAIPLLFFILALVVCGNLFYNANQLSPTKEAMSFLADIKSGRTSKIVRHFGTNVCHCPKKKGWGAYLAYQTDEEPNLAFLLGHPFIVGEINATPVASPPQARHGVPFEHPEDYIVNVQLEFDQDKYSPLFLPLPMSYGKSMTNQEFDEFIKDPSKEAWKSFSLRLRSSLKKGAIAFDTSNIDPDVRGEFKFITEANKSSNNSTQSESKTINKPVSWYLVPKDPGLVISRDGNEFSPEKVAALLPRLRETTLELRIVRSAKLQPWTVSELDFKQAILERSDNHSLIKLMPVKKVGIQDK